MRATAIKTRAKRFERRRQPASFQLTERDLTLLRHIARHRFLSSQHLAQLDGGSEQNVLRSLRILFDHGYVDRPHAQLAHVPVTGPRPMVYGLGRRGAQAVRDEAHRINGSTDWTERNKRAGAKFIEHTLAIADFMVGLEVACRGRADIELLHEHDIIAEAPEKTRKAREPLRLVVPGLDNKIGVSSVVADGLFALVFADGTASYFLLEVDRGSMPVVRSQFDRTSYNRKLRVYWEAWKKNRHVEHLGVKQIRVLTVTESAARVDHMINAVQDITGGKGSNFFLFAEKSRFFGRLPTEVWWTTGRGEAVKLTD
jgi:Replication-relaxation